MSIWGDLDADDVANDPNWVAPNTYKCVCTSVIQKEMANGSTSLIFQWAIQEPDSDFDGKGISEFFRIFPGQAFADLDTKQKQALSYLKKRLMDGFDLSEEEVKTVAPSELEGVVAYVKVTETDGTGVHEGKTFTNVRAVTSERSFLERADTSVAGL